MSIPAFLLSTLLTSAPSATRADLAAIQAPNPAPRAPDSPGATVSAAPGPDEVSDALAPLEAEVLRNIREQPLGPATVDDLALPDRFLLRFADRIIRTSYEQSFRIVVADAETPAPDATNPSASTAATPQVVTAVPPTDGQPKKTGEEFGAVLWKRAIAGALVLVALIWVFARTKRKA